MGNEKSRKKLENVIKEDVTKMFESILDYAQVACSAPETFKVLRSKILRVGNNCIRSINTRLERYDISSKVIAEEIIEFEDSKNNNTKA